MPRRAQTEREEADVYWFNQQLKIKALSTDYFIENSKKGGNPATLNLQTWQ